MNKNDTEIKKSGSGDRTILRRVNKTCVSGEELFQLAEEVHRLPEEERDFDGASITAVKLFQDADLALSAYFRVKALAKIVSEGGLPGWCEEPQADGNVTTHHSLWDAAGQAPLRRRANDLVFSRSTLLKKAFQLRKLLNE